MVQRRIDTRIFERARSDVEAHRARRLENIYHVGQKKLWDGRSVLDELVQQYGPPKIAPETKRALSQVFSGLMWGEYAAWRISAQLADRIDDLEPKMAATAQTHDEARHFYVLHDYLELLGLDLPDLDRPTRFLLETVLSTDSLAEKLIGMQLLVETMALTIFKAVRELEVEPVLTALLPYYERDEARHIGLGVQHAPALLLKLSVPEQVQMALFQSRVLFASLATLKHWESSLIRLGVDARGLAETGKQKLIRTMEEVREANQGQMLPALATPFVNRSFEVVKELMFPRGRSVSARAVGLFEALTVPVGPS